MERKLQGFVFRKARALNVKWYEMTVEYKKS